MLPEEGADLSADVRIVVDFAPKTARYRPPEAEIVVSMNRIMQPKAVAVIGDGALGSGLALEGLNHAGGCRANLLVVLNGLGWAFHTPVSRGFLQEILERVAAP